MANVSGLPASTGVADHRGMLMTNPTINNFENLIILHLIITIEHDDWSSPRHVDTELSDFLAFECHRTDLTQSTVPSNLVVVGLDALGWPPGGPDLCNARVY